MTTRTSSTVPPMLSFAGLNPSGTETGKDSTEVGKDAKVTKDPAQLLADA